MVFRDRAETLPMPGVRSSSSPAHPVVEARKWCFDGFSFDLRRGELCGRDGLPVALRPKTEALLRQLLAQPGRLFSRDQLMAVIWPDTVVTDDSLVQCVGDLRTALGDQAQRLIRTVPRRGYRFEGAVEPVFDAPTATFDAPAVPPATQARPLTPEPAASERPRWPWPSPSSSRLYAVLLASLTALLVGAAVLALRPTTPPVRIDDEISARNTVAVMPFATAGDQPLLRHVADASADAISSQLSTRIGMRGIGRSSTAAYDGTTQPLFSIAKALKASHVVTGRVALAAGGAQVTMDVQLLSMNNSEVIWARRYEADIGNGAALSADVGLHVVNAVRNRKGKGSPPLTPPGREPSAAELTMLGWKDLDTRKSIEDVWRARTRFQVALRVDPESVIALNGLAASYSMERSDPMNRLTVEQVAEHERTVERSRKLAPEDSTALMLWGNVQMMRGRADLALPAVEKAARLVPSYPNGHVLIAQALLMLGRTDEVQANADRAVELGASDPRRVSTAYALAAEAALMRGEDDRAYDLAGRSIAALPSNYYGHATLAAIDALAGRDKQAADAMATFLKLWPTATVARYDQFRPSTHPLYLAQRARFHDGLRKAGLPER